MITLILILMTLGICLIAAATDVAIMKIPNILVLCVLCLYTQYAIVNYSEDNHHIAQDALAALILFVLTTILFFTNIIGGGDAKLMSALGFWVGLNGLAPFLFVMSVAGLGVGVTAIILKKALKNDGFYNTIPEAFKHPTSWVGQLRQNKSKVPYGVAIACGAFASFHVKGLLVLSL